MPDAEIWRHGRRYVTSMAVVLGSAALVSAAYASDVSILLYLIPTLVLLIPGGLLFVWVTVRLSREQTEAARFFRFIAPVVTTYLAVVVVQLALRALPLALDRDVNPLDPTHGLTFVASLGAAIFGVREAMRGTPPRP